MRYELELLTPPHIQEWCSLLEPGKGEYLIECSRDHGKSWTFSFAYAAWRVYRSIHQKEAPSTGLLISYSAGQSEINMRFIKNWIEQKHPDWIGSTWGADCITFHNGMTIFCRGMGGSTRGIHAEWIICDDIAKDVQTLSLEDQENYIKSVAIPALKRGGLFVVVGTPVDVQDILCWFEGNPEFTKYRYPAIKEDGTPLWPEQYSLEDLEKRKKIIGSYTFNSQYMLKRESPDDAIFKAEWFRYYETLPTGVKQRTMTVDPCGAKGTGDDFAIVITDIFPNGHKYVVHSFGKPLGIEAQVDMIFSCYKEFRPDIVGIETFAFQRVLKHWIEVEQDRRNCYFPIECLEQHVESTRSKARILALQPAIESNTVFFRKQEDAKLLGQLIAWRPGAEMRDDVLHAFAYHVPFWNAPKVSEKKEYPANSFGALLAKHLKSQHVHNSETNFWSGL